MIFGLPAILGFIPLAVYIILAIRGKNMVMTVVVAVIVGAVLTGQSLIGFGGILAESLGSFLAMIGFIIMLGAGLGEVLTRTKVAHNLVSIVLNKIKLKNQTMAIIVAMLLSTLLVAMLGTLAGANAILAPIVIPVLASFMLTRSSVGVLLHGAGAVGLMIGPFVPPVVTILELTGVSYVQYLVGAGIPLAIVIWIITFFVTKHVQKCTAGKTDYSDEDRTATHELVLTSKIKLSTTLFLIGMVLLLGYGIYAHAGAAYAMVVMLVMSFVVGFSAGMSGTEILDAIIAGCARMFGMFLMFVLFEPLMIFITNSGAFDALAGYLQPVLDKGGSIVFAMISTLIGIFGISGAAVAQSKVIHEMFGPMAVSLNMPMTVWALIIMVGSQITSFAYPTGDMMGQMGLARSQDVKSMMKNGIAITIATIALVFIRTLILSVAGI